MQHSWELWKYISSFLWFICFIKNKISICLCNTSNNNWFIRKSMHFGVKQTNQNKKNSSTWWTYINFTRCRWKEHSVHCSVSQLEPNKSYLMDELNFLIYCIWMCNIIGFILNIKFANVTYCSREWKENLIFFQKCIVFRSCEPGMRMSSSEGVNNRDNNSDWFRRINDTHWLQKPNRKVLADYLLLVFRLNDLTLWHG